jgi:hypothetical protein
MGFVGLCWGFTPKRKSNLMFTCGGAFMSTPKTCINKEVVTFYYCGEKRREAW